MLWIPTTVSPDTAIRCFKVVIHLPITVQRQLLKPTRIKNASWLVKVGDNTLYTSELKITKK